uniref:TolC family protein n=1 Tax=Cellvibrio fontiphilus TaxID=1815559 RepID=UPI002B4BC473|nr:TolC family protein [Cellvibrio fontiphilus]
MKTIHKNTTLLLVLGTSLLLGACSSTATKNSMAPVQQAMHNNFPLVTLDENYNKPALTAPVDSTSTLQLADALELLFTHSPEVRIELAKLGVADAQRLQAELISNPHLAIGALRPEGGGRWKLETGLSQPLLELFTRPLRRTMAEQNLLRTQLQLQAALQGLIIKTQKNYYNALAAAQHLQVQTQVLQASQAQHALALSLYRAGNMAENQFLYYDNELRHQQQAWNERKLEAEKQRLQLLAQLGLSSTSRVGLPLRLPLLKEEKLDKSQLIAQAQQHRLDAKIIQQQIALAQQRKMLLKKEKGWRDMSAGINAEREPDSSNNMGAEIEFALPLFNRNQGKIAIIDAQITGLEAELQQQQLQIDKEISTALVQLTTAQQQLVLINQALQVAQKRVELAQREVNFMLTSPFELLAIKEDEIQLAHDYTHSLKRYWLSRSQLELALGKSLDAAAPAEDSHADHSTMDHSKMDHSKMDHSKMDHSSHRSNHNMDEAHKIEEPKENKASKQEEHQHD